MIIDVLDHVPSDVTEQQDMKGYPSSECQQSPEIRLVLDVQFLSVFELSALELAYAVAPE